MAGRSESTVFKEGDGALCVGAPVQKVKKGWKWSKLRDLASMHSGHTPSRRHPEWWGGDIKWIRVADARPCHGGGIFETGETINENGLANSAAELLPPGTVCLSRSASIGYVVILEDEMCTNQGFANWICGEQLIPRFLQLLFLREQKFLDRIATGTAHRTIYYPDLKAFHILHPSRQEQERIVEVLDEAFAAIDKAKANIERNLTNARELFQSRLNDIFSDPSNDWELKPLGDVCTFKSGGTPSKSRPQFWGDGIPWISSKDMKFDLILETQDSVTLEAVGQGTRAVKPGTLLIVVRSGILMRKIPIALTGVDATFNQDIKALMPNSELSSEFLFWFLKASEPTLLKLVTRSATVHRLETSVLTSFQIPIPESKEQEALVKTASLLNRLKKELELKYQSELDNLEELRQSILEQAFEGKLTEPVAA